MSASHHGFCASVLHPKGVDVRLYSMEHVVAVAFIA